MVQNLKFAVDTIVEKSWKNIVAVLPVFKGIYILIVEN